MEKIQDYSVITPGKLGYHFMEICKRPHISGKEQEVREYLKAYAESREDLELLYYKENPQNDGEKNVIIYRPAPSGTPLLVQAHIDMVCKSEKKTEGSDEDIFPILWKYTDNTKEWIKGFTEYQGKSWETTLGADNGIGAAAALTLLEEENMPPLYALFTVREEDGLNGAQGLDPEHLKQIPYMINMDSEELHIITYGCAGGKETTFSPRIKKRQKKAKEIPLQIILSGLAGGHSGMCIHEERANSVKLLARMLYASHKEQGKNLFDFTLGDFKGGSATNAIPDRASCVVYISKNQITAFTDHMNSIFPPLKKPFTATDPGMTLTIKEPEQPPASPWTSKSTKSFLNLLMVLPHGILRQKDASVNLVETSTNVAMIYEKQRTLKVNCSHRSLSLSGLTGVSLKHSAIGKAFGIKCKQGRYYPNWEPVDDSRLLLTAREVYREAFGEKALSTVVHAGLECGAIKEKLPDIEAISIGPDILGAHTTEERVNLKSITLFYENLLRIIAGL